ncbi:uncharacterized protein LOC119080321 [Bradysia coprophila]|uniref:uncharacterized protein LOC119080321 n=1 Tax=Bradysia coprophila TaxID=38358 RepID=UPI00187D9D5E|nr:uncharacterized protein LOC119080321 [Bradysia coprophila]
MKVIIAVLLVVLPQILCENIIKLDLSPEEAQKYIDGANSVLKFAPKLNAGPIPDGEETYYRGRIIDNPSNFIKETYLANQFHGQNGLGQAKFGYSDWNQARQEHIDVNGKTEGSYNYVLPNGHNYEVKYWADSEGFHQTDNRPEPVLVPVTDTPAVKAAKEAHAKAWEEAAAAARASGYDAEASEDQYNYKNYENDGPTGPPRGFFYNIDYPVHLIVDKSESNSP